MKRDTMVLLVVVALVVTGAAVLWAHHGPEKVVLNAAGADAKRAPVEFPHKVHVEAVESCDTCHHTSEGMTTAANIEVPKCSSCHLNPDPGVPGIREMGMRNNPYHITCVGCHREQSKGPTTCNDCHPRS